MLRCNGQVQEVKLPPEIYTAAVEACKSAYLPIKAKAEAIQRQLQLKRKSMSLAKTPQGSKKSQRTFPLLPSRNFLLLCFWISTKRKLQR